MSVAEEVRSVYQLTTTRSLGEIVCNSHRLVNAGVHAANFSLKFTDVCAMASDDT